MGAFQGPPVTIGRRRRTADDAGVLLSEVRTTAADDEPTAAVRATATRGAGAFEAGATPTFGAAFLAAAVAVVLCAVLFFFFLVVVVGVPSRSAPDSSNAEIKSGIRRIIKVAATCNPWLEFTGPDSR